MGNKLGEKSMKTNLEKIVLYLKVENMGSDTLNVV